jgi:large subunit ribosomal protein L18
MNPQKIKQLKKIKRAKRVRAKVIGTKTRPRLTIYRGLKHLYAQVIDDSRGKTLFAASDFDLSPAKRKKIKKMDLAKEVGLAIAKKAKDKKIDKVVFDRRGYKYHGIIKSFADGAREGGLEF